MRPDEASGGMGESLERGRGRERRAAAAAAKEEREGRKARWKKVANQIGKKKKETGESFPDDDDGGGDERPRPDEEKLPDMQASIERVAVAADHRKNLFVRARRPA